MEDTLIVLVTASFVIALHRYIARAVTSPTPAGSVLFISVTYLVGAAIVYLRESNEQSLLVYSACAVFFGAYLVSYFAATSAFDLRDQPGEPIVGAAPESVFVTTLKWLTFIGALGATAFLVFVVGADRLLAALYSFLFSNSASVSVNDLRVSISAGEERWIAPGYLKQLRDIFLPFAALVVLFTIRRTGRRFVLLALVIVPTICILVISSGERGPVLLFILGAIYAAFRSTKLGVYRARLAFATLGAVSVLGSIAFYALTSSFTSRYEDQSPNVALIFLDRVVVRYPEENAEGADIWSVGAPFPGAGWLSELASVAPGTQETLSNLIHERLTGGSTGNSVLGLWIDVFYNFDWFLGIAVSVALGIALAVFNHWVNGSRAACRTADVCGLWISLCMLLVFSPFGFLLYGPFLLSACLFVIVLGKSLHFGPKAMAQPSHLISEGTAKRPA